jgi:hypothetical protein
MLTLKLVVASQNGQQETHLFYGERISHKERKRSNSDKSGEIPPNQIILGGVYDVTGSEEQFINSNITIFGSNDVSEEPIYDILVYPCADCYVMHEGKTIDTFYTKFIK